MPPRARDCSFKKLFNIIIWKRQRRFLALSNEGNGEGCMYGCRSSQEMGAALQKIQAGVARGDIESHQINQELFQQNLYTQVNVHSLMR